MLQQRSRTRQTPFIDSGVTAFAQSNQIAQLVGGKIIAVEGPPFDNVVDRKSFPASADLTFVSITLQCFASLCKPIRAASVIKWLRATLPIAVVRPLLADAIGFILTLLRAISTCALCREESRDRVALSARFTLFCDATFGNRLSAVLRAILSRAIGVAFKFFSATRANARLVLAGVRLSIFVCAIKRTILFLAAGLDINSLAAMFAFPSGSAFLRLSCAAQRTIFSIWVLRIAELFAATEAGLHSVSLSLPHMMVWADGVSCRRFGLQSLAHFGILPQKGAQYN